MSLAQIELDEVESEIYEELLVRVDFSTEQYECRCHICGDYGYPCWDEDIYVCDECSKEWM